MWGTFATGTPLVYAIFNHISICVPQKHTYMILKLWLGVKNFYFIGLYVSHNWKQAWCVQDLDLIVDLCMFSFNSWCNTLYCQVWFQHNVLSALYLSYSTVILWKLIPINCLEIGLKKVLKNTNLCFKIRRVKQRKWFKITFVFSI